jgi:hypothetical protein
MNFETSSRCFVLVKVSSGKFQMRQSACHGKAASKPCDVSDVSAPPLFPGQQPMRYASDLAEAGQ